MPAQLDASQLRSGDILFIRVGNLLYRKVAETTGSWDSHVGIFFREPDGELIVAESTVPRCKFTKLDAFLDRSERGMVAVRRLPAGLSDDQIARLRSAADRRRGRFYHLGFRYDSGREFCSKFVHDVFQEAVGVELGRLETFRNLLSSNPDAPVGFWRLWFFGFIPWNRRTVTPNSLLRSPRLVTVFDNAAQNV